MSMAMLSRQDVNGYVYVYAFLLSSKIWFICIRNYFSAALAVDCKDIPRPIEYAGIHS